MCCYSLMPQPLGETHHSQNKPQATLLLPHAIYHKTRKEVCVRSSMFTWCALFRTYRFIAYLLYTTLSSLYSRMLHILDLLERMVWTSSRCIFFFSLSGKAWYHFCSRTLPCRLNSNTYWIYRSRAQSKGCWKLRVKMGKEKGVTYHDDKVTLATGTRSGWAVTHNVTFDPSGQ